MNPAKHAIYNIITAIGVGVIAIIMLFVLTQNRNLSQQIKDQTNVNQRYLKCIILLPREAYGTTESRAEALDKCSKDSQLR